MSDTQEIADEVERRMRRFHRNKTLVEWGIVLAASAIVLYLDLRQRSHGDALNVGEWR